MPFRKGHLYTILGNPLYRGEVKHKGAVYAGDHEATQPIDLSLDRLINAKLPLDWAEQRSVLGFK